MAKPFIVGFIETNEKSLECNFYKTMGVNAYAAAAVSLFTAQFYAAGGAAAVGGAAELAYNLSGCDDPPPPVPDTNQECWKTDGPSFLQYTQFADDWALSTQNAVEILSQEVYQRSDGRMGSKGDIKLADGQVTRYVVTHNDPNDTRVRLFGAPCVDESPSPPLDHPPGTPIADPVEVEDPDTNCTWTIQATDAYVDSSGIWHTYYTVTANDPACGGPFSYWDTQGGPPVFVNPPEGDEPTPPPGNQPCPDPCPEIPPCPPCPECPPIPPPYELPAAVYQLTGVCEDVAQGQPQPTAQWSVPSNRYEIAIAARLDAIAAMLQQHLAWKTPTCNVNPTKEGEFRTISFISDEQSPNGRNRLRKRFRYRSVSGIGLAGVVDHWRDFTWQAGPVCVSHKGAYWGAPQVWAATAEEGKRVIRHAAVEAGLDPDQAGRWLVSGSDNPRFGVSGTMRVNTSGGYYWITERLESNGRPLVEET